MARAGLRKIARYGDRFKATAVKLSSLPGVLIQDVACALDIHEGEAVDASAFKALVRRAVALNNSGKPKPSKKAQTRSLRR